MNIKNFIKKHWFIICIILLYILKIFLVNCQIIYVKVYTHDDYYFVKAASSLVQGNWLGNYNDITLSKGISGMLLIAFAYKTGMGYLSILGFSYFLACVSVVKLLKHFINNKWGLLIIYTLLLFHPVSYSDAFNFVYRDGFYTILIVFLFTFSFEIFFHYFKSMRYFIIYIILYSISFTLAYFCREETICIVLYFMISIGIIISFIILDRKCENKIIRVIMLLFIPSFFYFGMYYYISYQNLIHYNRFIPNDFTSKDFQDLYGSLTRIKQKNYIKRVPLNYESRQILYEKSPMFKTLEPYLESEKYHKKYTHNLANDYQEGFLYWAIRNAGYELGYYESAKDAYVFHTMLAKEINDLCDSKQLNCTKKRSSLIAPIQKELIPDFFYYIPLTFYTEVTYSNLKVVIPERDNNPSIYTEITLNKDHYDNNGKIIRLKIMEYLLFIYKIINSILFIVSGLLFLYMIPFFVRTWKKNYPILILLFGLLFLYLLRIGAVSFVATTEYSAALDKSQYLAPAIPIQMILSILIIYFFYYFIIQKKELMIDKKI